MTTTRAAPRRGERHSAILGRARRGKGLFLQSEGRGHRKAGGRCERRSFAAIRRDIICSRVEKRAFISPMKAGGLWATSAWRFTCRAVKAAECCSTVYASRLMDDTCALSQSERTRAMGHLRAHCVGSVGDLRRQRDATGDSAARRCQVYTRS